MRRKEPVRFYPEVGEVKAEFMEAALFKDHLEENKQMKQSTIDEYTNVIIRFLSENEGADLADIIPYNRFLMRYSVKKHCSYHSPLKEFIKYKMPNALLRAEMAELLISPRRHNELVKERVYLDEDTILEVINGLVRFKHRMMGLLQHLTGVRYHDIISLKEEWLMYEDYEGTEVLRMTLSGKGSKRNVVHIFDPIATGLLELYLENKQAREGYVFLEDTLNYKTGNLRRGADLRPHKLMKRNYWWYLADLKQALVKAGVEPELWATHDYRRAFARRFWERHKDIHALKNLLRHASIETTMRYLEYGGLQNIDYFREMQTT